MDTSSPSTSDQWAAILRYDASRRESYSTSNAAPNQARRNSEQAPSSSPLNQLKRLSLGDDLPHMPVASSTAPPPPFQSRSSLGSTMYLPEMASTSERPRTPPALKGQNATLVDREVDRLRDRHLKTLQRHWRIYTGTVMLVILGICTFVFTKYVLAFLALSPASWVLSDAPDGILISPDPLLRILALIGVCASGVSLLGVLSSGFYLRFSRQRSCGTLFVWLAAILSTTISLLLCVINLALIAILHKKYASSNDMYAATRDVSRRCSRSWALDMLWQAARSSSQAKANTSTSSTCLHDAKRTLQDYLVAGGIRLVVIVAFCTLWLFCLAKYNRSLQFVDDTFNDVQESAEMHKLLMEVEEGKQMSDMRKDGDLAMPEIYTPEAIARNNAYTDCAPPAPPPRLGRFRWQKEASTVDEVHEQHNREASAGAWSIGIVGQVWGALWGTNGTANHHHQVALDDNEDDLFTPLHDRQATKLGVRGWFRREVSDQVSDDYGRMASIGEDHEPFPPHLRTPSQEKRAREGRHAAARLAKIREEESIIEARDRGERRNLIQEERLDFLANLAGDGKQEEPKGGHRSRRSSQSAGDDLPHMPDLTRADDTEGNDGVCWQPSHRQSSSEERDKRPSANLYVRTMGKLIRTLSAIESEGSQERLSRAGRSSASGTELY
jgi:hypothetical protein